MSLAAVWLAGVSPAAGAETSPPTQRSTGQQETALEPARPPIDRLPIVSSTPVAFAAGAASLVHEGTISRSGPVEIVLSPVPEGMLEIRVLAKSGGDIWMSIFRDDGAAPEPGTLPESEATTWISSGDGTKKLRVVAYLDGDETPFRVAIRVSPAAVPGD